MAYHRQQGVDTAIVRIFNTYGPRMRPHDGRAIPTFMRQALQDRPITVFGDGSPDAVVLLRQRPDRRHHPRSPSPATTTRSTSATRTSSRCSSWPRPSSRSPARARRSSSRRCRPTTRRCASPTSRSRARCSAGSRRSALREGLRRTHRGIRASRARRTRRGSATWSHARRRSNSAHMPYEPVAALRPGRSPWLTRPQPTRPRSRGHRRPRRRPSTLPARRRPPQAPAGAVASCCGWRRCAASSRVVSLLALDFAGVFAAIFTALMVKAVLRDGTGPGTRPATRPRSTSPSPTCVTVLLFARSGLYADRAAAARACRGSSRRCSRSTRRRADLRARQRRAVLELLHLLRHALLRDRLRRARCAGRYEQVTGAAAARRRLPPPRGAGRLRQAHRGRRARAARRGPRADRDASASSRSTPRPDNGLRSLGRIEDLAEVLDAHRVDEVIIADPDFPQEQARRARRPVPPARRARAHRAVDDGDPHPPRGVRARRSRCRCSSCARRSSRASTSWSSARSTSSARCCCCSCSARCCC